MGLFCCARNPFVQVDRVRVRRPGEPLSARAGPPGSRGEGRGSAAWVRMTGCRSCPRSRRSSDFLRERTAGLVIARVDVGNDQRAEDLRPTADGAGRAAGHRRRPGTASSSTSTSTGMHLVFHLARAGWLRWSRRSWPRRRCARARARSRLRVPTSPTARGFDLTEAGTRKRLAAYIVRDPQRGARHRDARPRPARPTASTGPRSRRCWPAGARRSRGVLRDQSLARRRRQRLQRRGPARGQALAVRRGRERWTRSRWTGSTTRCATVLDHGRRRRPRASRPRSSRTPSGPACACTAAPGCPARSAATPCARCRSPTRSLQYCPTCQTGGKPLADRRMSRLLK